MEKVSINDEWIRLSDAMKVAGVCGTGGQAKLLVQSGQVTVNGEVELRRGRKLQPGDQVVRTDTGEAFRIAQGETA